MAAPAGGIIYTIGRAMRARQKVVVLHERFRTSLWPVPAFTAAVGVALALLLVRADRHLDTSGSWYAFAGGPEGARELLSTISSSMLTFTALAFSITVVALQLASGQFSPRALRTFLQDGVTKTALGMFVGTFVYSTAVLSQVRDVGGGFVPAISVWVAFVLILASVGVFIVYINRMAHSVRAISLITRVSSETRESIARMYPEEGEDDPEGVAAPSRAPDFVVLHDGPPGVLTAVDTETLFREADAARAIVALEWRVGDFVPGGAPLFRVWALRPIPASTLRAALDLEPERNLEQDPAAGFRQLVDIAARALSPGVNDPTTAVQVLDHLHDLVRRLARKRFPTVHRLDTDGQLRLVLPRPGFGDYARLAFEEIRHYGRESMQVRRKLRLALEDCLAVASPSRRAPLLDELRRLTPEEEDARLGGEGELPPPERH